MDRLLVFGGGTFTHLRNHLAISAPAFGTTAKKLHNRLIGSELFLTKMADTNSVLMTNMDVELFIDDVLKDKNVKTIILNIAFCDYEALPIDNIENGSHADRLSTSNGNINIELKPTKKVVKKIKKERPDIFLVSFKTTTNKTIGEQIEIGNKSKSDNLSNIVFCNDTVTRQNIIISDDGVVIFNNRNEALETLCQIIKK
jgi:phosphopantothenoylcysteine synthetase/decarboxylase